ncbi:MAG: universal stress protein [Polyangiaceae bacterium]
MSQLVVGVDFSHLSPLVVSTALGIAESRPEVQIHVVHVAKNLGAQVRLDLPDGERVLAPQEAAAYLADYTARALQSRGGPTAASKERVTTHLRVGTPSTEVVELAAELDADLIVVGTEGTTGVERFLLGSTAENVVRKAGCPVWVVREKGASET